MRKDCYVQDKFVLIPNNINKNETLINIIHQNKKPDSIKDEKNCPYCPGKKQISDELILSFVFKDGILQRLYDSQDSVNENWTIRVFECRNPIVTTTPNHEYSDKPYYREPAYGYDLIVIPTPQHDVSLTDLSMEQWTNLLLVLQDRVRWLYSQRGVTYVAIYASRGPNGGSTNYSSPLSYHYFFINSPSY